MRFVSLLLVGVVYSSISIQDIRTVYQSQNEEQVLAMLKKLEQKSEISADERCYKAVFQCMKADYLTWPADKLSAFKKGYSELNTVINRYPSNAEYRYHRYMIEKHTPSWLIEESHMAKDKAFVKSNIPSSHPMYSFITKTIDK